MMPEPGSLAPCRHLSGLWPPDRCARLLAQIEPAWQALVPGSVDYVPEASSLRLRSLAGMSVQALAASLRTDPRVADGLGSWAGEWRLLEADCWVRRQPAPRRARPPHRPHAWHQDGALGFDFIGDLRQDAPPRRIVTCWLALQPCGIRAPGLEWVDVPLRHLMRPEALSAPAVAARFPAAAFRRPGMEAGDALLFDGTVLHRTHAESAMDEDRTSIELRFEAVGS